MHAHSPAPIWLPLHPSRRLRYYLLLLHASALLAVLMLQLPWALRLIGVALAGISLGVYWRRYVLLRGGAALRSLHWRSNGDCWLTDGANRVTVYTGVRAELLLPELTVLRLTGAKPVRWLVLPDDCADRQALRQLRVRVRRQSPGPAQDSPLRGT